MFLKTVQNFVFVELWNQSLWADALILCLLLLQSCMSNLVWASLHVCKCTFKVVPSRGIRVWAGSVCTGIYDGVYPFLWILSFCTPRRASLTEWVSTYFGVLPISNAKYIISICFRFAYLKNAWGWTYFHLNSISLSFSLPPIPYTSILDLLLCWFAGLLLICQSSSQNWETNS